MSTSTTTNYGWTIPNDDELVKNGAAAIRTLGQAIDTTAAASFSSGVVLLDAIDFSSVSSVSLANDTFTTDYENYNVKIEVSAISVDNTFRFRYRASGSDDTSGSYIYSVPAINYLNTASNNYSGAGATSHQFGSGDAGTSGHFHYADIYINKPASAIATLHTLNYTAVLQVGGQYAGAGGGWHNVATAYDSMTFFPSSGTFSGRIWVYGYKD